MLTEVSRYSNTLLVSLNNRIYFRDHPTRGNHVDCDNSNVLNLSHRSVMTSLQFANVEPPSHTTTMGDNLQPSTIPNTIDLEKAKDDDVSILPSEPRC
jgi:hypothetical protein